MKKFYQVYENTQQSDGDCWAHWVEESPISYHSTIEGAERKIKSLLDAQIAQIPKFKELNPHIPEESWLEEEALFKNNAAWYTQDNNGEHHYKGTLYNFKEITLED
jgi:hypothetical protein